MKNTKKMEEYCSCEQKYDKNNTKKREGSRYLNMMEPVIIICRIHGEFLETPHRHLQGYGCPKCGDIPSKTS